MQKILLFTAIVVVLLATDICVAQTPSERGIKREKEECEEMAMQAETNPRASASAVSVSEAMAYKKAMTEARSELAAQIAAEITGFMRHRVEQYMLTAGAGSNVNVNTSDFRGNASGKEKSSTAISALIEADSAETVQRVAQIISNTHPVCKNVYDRKDGSVQVYVCVEMGLTAQQQTFKQLKEEGVFDKDLNGDGKNDIDLAEKEFLIELAKAREEYNAKKAQKEE
jgi:hypothetical protein